MNKKLINRLFLIASAGLFAASVIFLCLGLFGEEEGSWPLISALICVGLGLFFNLIRQLFNKE